MTEDVIQGDLGDCYFLAVLSAWAEFPERIEALFPNKNISPNGIFEIKVYIHGSPISVVIDDFVPCKENKNEPGKFEIAFTGLNPKTKNIWPMLLEKVWAKVNLNYFNIVSGVPSEAFEFLSPAPFDTYHHDQNYEVKIFDEIKNSDLKQYIICCSINVSDSSTNLDYLERMGLIGNHAYSIIDVQ